MRARGDLSARAGDEAGVTLVEILVTVWIMGAVVTAMSGALFTMVKSSDINRRQSLAEAELRRFAETVRRTKYIACAGGATSGGTQTQYSDPTIFASSYQFTAETTFWEQSSPTSLTVDPATFVSASDLNSRHSHAGDDDETFANRDLCDPADGPTDQRDDGIQLVTLEVHDAGQPVASATTTVLKRVNDR